MKSDREISDGENRWREGGEGWEALMAPKTQLASDTQGQRDTTSGRQTENYSERDRGGCKDDKNREGWGAREMSHHQHR